MSSLDLQLPSPMPAWLPGESLFSLLSRFHQLSGHRLASDTCRALFGSSRSGCQHDFPSRLGELCGRVQGALGEPADLVCRRTLLPFYLPLQRPDQAGEAIAALVDSSTGVLKFRLGILTSRFRANHPLKACLDCMSADRRVWGTTYWHLKHQLPGVWLCTDHQSLLSECQVKSTGVARFGWILPDEAHLRSTMTPTEQHVLPALAALAGLAEAWNFSPPGTFFDSTRLATAYRGQAARLFGSQALSVGGRCALSESFHLAIEPLRVIPELRALPGSAREAWLQIQRWILAPRGGTHPLRHLAIIFWLFQDWSQFLAAYEAAAVERTADPASEGHQFEGSSAVEVAFLSSVRGGLSISAAARTVGVTANTGMAWAAKSDIAVQPRPKTLGPEVRAAVVAALRKGGDKAELARLHGVSDQAVTRILQTEPRLREAWRAARHQVALNRARSSWSDASLRLRGLPTTSIRREAPDAYAWLYRNDREWLDLHRPSGRARTNFNGSRVDWDGRDTVLSAEVRRVASDLLVEACASRVELWQIFQRLPELRAKLGALERLPLTLRAIQEVTCRRRGRPGRRLF